MKITRRLFGALLAGLGIAKAKPERTAAQFLVDESINDAEVTPKKSGLTAFPSEPQHPYYGADYSLADCEERLHWPRSQ